MIPANRRKTDGLSLEEKVDILLLKVEELFQAFPEGVHKHRETHEAWIEAKKAEQEFYNRLKLELVQKGLLALGFTLLGLLFLGFKTKIMQILNLL